MSSPTKALSLYDLENNLAALLDTGDGGISPEQEEEFRAELATAMIATVEKRDRVGAFLRHVNNQAEFAAEEIKRLGERKAMFERAAERMKSYVKFILESQGQDEQGRWRKLEGKTVTFSLRKAPDTLQVDDEQSIPAQFKTVVTETRIDRRAVLAALKDGEDIPGADLRFGGTYLSVK